jgi:hypothetical protein
MGAGLSTPHRTPRNFKGSYTSAWDSFYYRQMDWDYTDLGEDMI